LASYGQVRLSRLLLLILERATIRFGGEHLSEGIVPAVNDAAGHPVPCDSRELSEAADAVEQAAVGELEP
jgi:hypothetical protein